MKKKVKITSFYRVGDGLENVPLMW